MSKVAGDLTRSSGEGSCARPFVNTNRYESTSCRYSTFIRDPERSRAIPHNPSRPQPSPAVPSHPQPSHGSLWSPYLQCAMRGMTKPRRGLSGSAGVGRGGTPWDGWDAAGRGATGGVLRNGHVTVGSGLSHTSSVR